MQTERHNYPHISTMLPNLWSLLNDSEKELWQMYSTYTEYPNKSTLYKTGDSIEYCFLLVEGAVKVVMEGVAGRRFALHLVAPGQLFGYRVFFSGMTYDAQAEAIGPCLVYRVPITVLEDLCASNAELNRELLQETCAEMMVNDRRCINMMHKQSRARMAEALLYIREMGGVEDAGNLRLRPSRKDLAEMSNMSLPNAIRTLSALEDEGLIALKEKRITLLSVAQLRNVSEMG